MQVADQHLLDWSNVLFANQPLETGQSMSECWDTLVESNPDAAKHFEDKEVPEH